MIEFTCPNCGSVVPARHAGEVTPCPTCKQRLTRVIQLDQLLARWYEPRRWRADLVRPSVPYLVERLWTANGQGERLYAGVGPKYTNYDIFRHLVTRLMIEGIDAGWAELQFPDDPLAEDPQYVLTIVDSEQFARGVEKLFPEVNWDEPVPAALAADLAPPRPAARGKRKRR
jgi:hypothetical protein